MDEHNDAGVTPGRLTSDQLRALALGDQQLRLDESCWPAVEAAQAVVDKAAGGGAPVYGINTGFGKLATVRIAPDQIEELQRRLVLSHMCGIGPALPDPVVRLVLALKAASLALGHSGVRRRTIELLLALLEHDALPVIPAKGSVGASGDLAPLAHLAGALIGEGEVRLGGAGMPAAAALARIGERPLTLAAKEGLALLNGTQVSTALALIGLFRAQAVFDAALVAGAMSVDAALGSDVPFDRRLNAVRGQPAQIRVAERLFALLAGSAIRASHREDASGCRTPTACAASRRSWARASICWTAPRRCSSARRTASPTIPWCSPEPTARSSRAATSMASRWRSRPIRSRSRWPRSARSRSAGSRCSPTPTSASCRLSSPPSRASTPASCCRRSPPRRWPARTSTSRIRPAIDSRPTSANQEDHVSMATHAARRLLEMTDNAAHIVAIELLAAAQGIELRRPLQSSAPLEAALAKVREHAAFLTEDRPLAAEIATLAEEILAGAFRDA